jgi:hypothetical protein
MASELMTTAAHAVTSKSVCMHAASRKAVTTPPMTHVGPATMGTKSMKPTASAVKAAKSMEPTASAKSMKPTASTVKAASTPTTMPAAATPMGDCRSVRDDAKRANRNARCQNTYCFLLHGEFLNTI